MVEKVFAIACAALGAGFGIGLADATVKHGEPKILSIGKETIGGVIFGTAGYNAGKQIFPILPINQKGE